MHASTAKYQTQIAGNPQAQEQLKKQSSLKTYKMTGVFFFPITDKSTYAIQCFFHQRY